jgi:hypothetical protein
LFEGKAKQKAILELFDLADAVTIRATDHRCYDEFLSGKCFRR